MSTPTSVWIVEDNELLRTAIERVLEKREDLEVSAMSSCERALERIDQEPPPDIVLMDIGLPGIDGIEGTRRIRERSPHTRVVMLTIREEGDDVFEALCAGASGYLLKPSSIEEIAVAVDDVVRGGSPVNPAIARKVLRMFRNLAGDAPAGNPGGYRLSSREVEVLEHLVDGLTLKEIAARLHLSPHTVNTHVRNIYAKLEVHSRSGAVARAMQHRLIRRAPAP